jgi:DNA recombination protein RmuC
LAWEHNVLLVSPSTLLFALRTVAQLWRYEDQARNVTDIAKRAGDLYDKFVGFVEDFEKVGVTLQMAQKHFGEAHNKLSSGNGNLIRRAEGLRALGVKPNKKLPQRLVEGNGGADHDAAENEGAHNQGDDNDTDEVTM